MVLDNLDSSTATGSDWLQDPESCGFPLPFCLELVIVFGEQVAHGCDNEVYWVLDPEPVHVAPKEILPPELRRAWEVIRLLILVQPFDVGSCDVPGPLQVEVGIGPFDHIEACILARVDNGIVDVRRVRYPERHKQVVDLVPLVLTNAVTGPLLMDVARVGEEGGGRPASEDRFQEVRFLGMGLEDAIGEASFFAFDKDLVQWVVFDEV